MQTERDGVSFFERVTKYALMCRRYGVTYGASTGSGGTWDCSAFIGFALKTLLNIPISSVTIDANLGTHFLFGRCTSRKGPNDIPLVFLQDRTSVVWPSHTVHVGFVKPDTVWQSDGAVRYNAGVLDQVAWLADRYVVDLKDVNGINYPTMGRLSDWWTTVSTTDIWVSDVLDPDMLGNARRWQVSMGWFDPNKLKGL